MNLSELFKWLAEEEWDLDRKLYFVKQKDADIYGPFLAAAPRTLAELAVDKVEQEATLIANEMCAMNPACNSPDDDYILNALQELGISELHYRAVVEKLEKVKKEAP